MAENPFGDIAAQVASVAFSSVLYIFIAVVVGGAILGLFMYIKWRKQFDIEVKIKSTRAEDKFSIIFDRAAIIKDKKDGTRYFELLNQKIELAVPPYNVLQTSSKGDFLELWRKSETEYIYLTPPKIDREYYMKSNGLLYPMADVKQTQLEGDVAYWRIKRRETNKGLFDLESVWMKLLPYVPQIIGGILVVFVLYVLFTTLPEVLNSLSQLTQELASLKGATIKTG